MTNPTILEYSRVTNSTILGGGGVSPLGFPQIIMVEEERKEGEEISAGQEPHASSGGGSRHSKNVYSACSRDEVGSQTTNTSIDT